MGSAKISSRDRESCQQLQLLRQFPRINVFNQNPNNLHDGNRSEELKYINEYPGDQKSNPSRRNAFGKWRSFKKTEEIKDDQGKNIVGYKQEYDFEDNQGNRNGLKMREYTRNKRGENDYSYCVIYKKKKYNYLSTSEELGRQPNEEHRSSLAPAMTTPSPSASQITNLSSAALNASDGNNIHGWVEKFLMTDQDSAPQNDQNFTSGKLVSIYDQFSRLV